MQGQQVHVRQKGERRRDFSFITSVCFCCCSNGYTEGWHAGTHHKAAELVAVMQTAIFIKFLCMIRFCACCLSCKQTAGRDQASIPPLIEAAMLGTLDTQQRLERMQDVEYGCFLVYWRVAGLTCCCCFSAGMFYRVLVTYATRNTYALQHKHTFWLFWL
jgi:hypothetical protein